MGLPDFDFRVDDHHFGGHQDKNVTMSNRWYKTWPDWSDMWQGKDRGGDGRDISGEGGLFGEPQFSGFIQ